MRVRRSGAFATPSKESAGRRSGSSPYERAARREVRLPPY
jgi:hypothetical protein